MARKQQQLSHLSQVFGVGYINQKRIMPWIGKKNLKWQEKMTRKAYQES